MGPNFAIAGLLLWCILVSQAEGALSQRLSGRSLRQAAAVAPAPAGEVCANGLHCPAYHTCDVSFAGADPVEEVYNCVCADLKCQTPTAIAAAPATGETCANRLVCAAPQRCDVTTIVTFDGGEESSYQCVCANGLATPDCQTPPSSLVPNSPPAAAPAPATGELCENGHVCPVHHRCDVSTVEVDGAEELVYQCTCANGYATPDCDPPPVPPTNVHPPAGAPAALISGTVTAAAVTATNPAENPAVPVDNKSGGLGVGAIFGIAVGSVALVSLLAAGGVFASKRRQQNSEAVEFQEFHRAHAVMDKPGDPPV
ncbi:hypothetical protein KFL_003290030 [Klebsormidium nitens]|uniref:EGF-like domain-containing protein n=1 Tax=Klebsormidium nitens TaxID=105231 RepID=A0A1Y1IEC6_KLENI|nr:hypothetical protein KFL_003290030 [Klebsormidium nitens]|eukprot:GAQ87067.1 hypothetical protein KFL_003290030 [Klebsormidium nitens]